jgi:hypothetical protein
VYLYLNPFSPFYILTSFFCLHHFFLLVRCRLFPCSSFLPSYVGAWNSFSRPATGTAFLADVRYFLFRCPVTPLHSLAATRPRMHYFNVMCLQIPVLNNIAIRIIVGSKRSFESQTGQWQS